MKKQEKTKTILDVIEERGIAQGRSEGIIKGEIKAIKTMASSRFQESPKRLNMLLSRLNDLDLLEKVCKFTSTAASLLDVEKFVESLIPVKPKARRTARKQIA